jgi:hypothetical protein
MVFKMASLARKKVYVWSMFEWIKARRYQNRAARHGRDVPAPEVLGAQWQRPLPES